jgi:DtxR family Mn-dependent transcriptional regulator
MPTSTVENYLKALYHLSEAQPEQEAVSLGDLARQLDLVPGTVTSMIKRLSQETDLIDYRPHKGAVLLEEGRRSALQILRRHRIIELFLVETVGMQGHQVHAEAENLEHAMSDDLVDRLAHLLGDPTHDPHGAPIPSASGEMPEDLRLSLLEAEPGEFQIVGLPESEPEFLAFTDRHGLQPGQALTVLANDRVADTISIQLQQDTPSLPIGSQAADKILVRRVSQP